jgi:hypothetical protein
MKRLIVLIIALVAFQTGQAQLLKKLKDKAQQTADNAINKAGTETTKPAEKNGGDKQSAGSDKSSGGKANLQVYSKFDFVPGTTIMHFDNFDKDNIGETPEGWLTNKSAELVEIEGLEGKWLKLAPTLSSHISRNKKQSWGNNFTIEFDMLMVKEGYDPRLGIILMNTEGKMVTDETLLISLQPALQFDGIIVKDGKSRISLTNKDNRTISDNMAEELTYENTVPVHISICVQGKRFRMWWNEKKLFDMPAINESLMPNQFGFKFGSVGGSDFYVTNIRIAKDVPDTRAKFEEGKLISNLLFNTGTSQLKPESMGSLLDVSKVLKSGTTPVKIIGHTDSDGEDAANLKLSQERAEAVKQILIKQYGVEADKLTTEGRGETQPISDNGNAEGKAQNRRVEFIFKPEADKYIAPTTQPGNNAATKQASTSSTKTSAPSGPSSVKLQSKLLTINLPYASFMKSGENRYTFLASKEEGNNKENFFKIEISTPYSSLKAETFQFTEAYKSNPLYGTKKFPEITKTEAVLYYGDGTKPYIYKFSPVIANGHMATYVTESLERKLPAASPNCKLVIEKVEDGKISGYFLFGAMNQGLKPITKGDAMTETFTDGFIGEIKCTFTNVPVF